MSSQKPVNERQRIIDLLQGLHDEGAIDLDKPLREVVPFVEKKMQAVQSVEENDFWWILVGKCAGGPMIFFCMGSDD